MTAYFYFHRQPVLTDKDTILLADFVNTTGEPVFDGATLKQGLAVQLQQSPFLNLFPDERARQTLRLMNKSPDERVTREVGREVALRQRLKAVITGAIAKFDRITSRYYGLVTGDEAKRIEVLMMQKRIYPSEWTGPSNLAVAYNRIGQSDKAIEEARESIPPQPQFPAPLPEPGMGAPAPQSFRGSQRCSRSRPSAEDRNNIVSRAPVRDCLYQQ